MTQTEEPRHELFICSCHAMEHQFAFTWFQNDKMEEREVYLTVHLSPDNFFKRIYNAIRYIFGHRSNYGEFDEIVIQPKDADRLQSVVNFLRKDIK